MAAGMNCNCNCTAKINELKEIVETQNQTIMEILATQNVYLQTLVRQQIDTNFVKTSFPILDDDDLETLDNKICHENKLFYVDSMRTLMSKNPKRKILAILCEDIVLNFNLDGTHGKKRLKDFANFYSVLKDAFDSDDNNPEDTIRKEFQNVKKQHFHVVSVKRKADKFESILIE